MLSQSLYVPSDGLLFKSVVFKKPIPEVRDMTKELARMNNYDLHFKRELNIKYKVSKIYLDFEDSLTTFNFQQFAAPFVTNTFHVQRKKAFKALDELTKDLSFADRQFHYQKFVEKVDKELLIKFKYHLKEPYVNLVFQKHYNLPKDINIAQVKEADAYKEMYNLSVIISIWSIEIEMSSDLVERAILYKLYQHKDEKNDVIQRLKSDRNLQNKFTVEGFSKRLLRAVLAKLVQRMSSFFSAKGLSFTSISWSACLGMIYYIMGQAAFPWTFILGNVSIPWICGGYLASRLLNNIGKKITRTEVISDLRFIGEAIQANAEELMAQYQGVAEAIDRCLSAESEKELDFFKEVLRKRIDGLLEPTTPPAGPKKLTGPLTQSRLCLSMLIVREDEDWVVCDLREDEEEENPDEDIIC